MILVENPYDCINLSELTYSPSAVFEHAIILAKEQTIHDVSLMKDFHLRHCIEVVFGPQVVPGQH